MSATPRKSHGSGVVNVADFGKIGEGTVIEPGVLVFHPENIEFGVGVYVGHYAILNAYYRNKMVISDGAWIGPQCYLHSAGGLTIGRNVGIGPAVKIITSVHREEGTRKAILHSRLEFAPVTIEENAHVGIGAIILPGVTVGRGAQVGAGAVVTRSVEPWTVVAGVPATLIRQGQNIASE